MIYSLRTKSLEDSITKRVEDGAHTFIEACPGDGTRYCLVFVDLDRLGASVPTNGGEGYVLVTSMADPRKIRSITISKNCYLHWTIIEEKLDMSSTSSAVTIGELIAHVVGCEAESRESFLKAVGGTADRPVV